ncbi:hypothetical protein GGU11DRAFT_767901 [Lentinula aff. detonsa]|nr:hypothetical protein GGU11DRAFT_767901 [Lentinula aff. detonsa]
MSLFPKNLREFPGKRSTIQKIRDLTYKQQKFSWFRNPKLSSVDCWPVTSRLIFQVFSIFPSTRHDALQYQLRVPRSHRCNTCHSYRYPSHPAHAVSLLDAQHPQPQSRQISKDEIHLAFCYPDDTGRPGTTPKIKKELKLIVEKYREHMNISKPFELSFENRYSGNIDDNFHEFVFWGKGDGWDCETDESPCGVLYKTVPIWKKSDPECRMASVYTSPEEDRVFDVTYAIRHRVLSESVHPVG